MLNPGHAQTNPPSTPSTTLYSLSSPQFAQLQKRHATTDQAAGGSNPSQRANGPLRARSGPNSQESLLTAKVGPGTSCEWSSPLSTAVDALSLRVSATICSVSRPDT